MLPHIAGRPLSIVRCPEGSGKPCFYQKHVGQGLPEGVESVPVKSKSSGKTEQYITISTKQGLISLAQMGVLEIHPWGSRNESMETPDQIIFDLDPDAEIEWKGLVASAMEVRDLLEQLGLESFAKSTGVSVLIIGHVTKEGVIAGPRILEHMVDTVLYFESDAGSRFRLVRAVKNRFGAANEVGVFAMTEQGLKEVKNPSAIFLSQHAQPVSGSAVMVAREGSRPLLIEVQALTDDAQGMNPRRVAVGLEANRLALLLAVLHRHGGVATSGRDVFVNVVGGVRISETAADLPAVLATVSSARDEPLAGRLVCFGELTVTSGNASTPTSWERALQLIADRQVDLEPLFSDAVPLAEWEQAFAATRNGAGIKYVLVP